MSGKGHAVTHVSTETGHYSSDLCTIFPKNIKETGFKIFSSTASVTSTLADAIRFVSESAEI